MNSRKNTLSFFNLMNWDSANFVIQTAPGSKILQSVSVIYTVTTWLYRVFFYFDQIFLKFKDLGHFLIAHLRRFYEKKIKLKICFVS